MRAILVARAVGGGASAQRQPVELDEGGPHVLARLALVAALPADVAVLGLGARGGGREDRRRVHLTAWGRQADA